VTKCVAALDCGSNSTRLLIVNAQNETVLRDSRITRLSQGVDASMTLTPRAMARSFDVLSDYRTMMDEAGVDEGLLVATSAVRDASNGDEFLDEARRRTGVNAKILTGHEEAAYSYAGATAGLETDARATAIVDVGGGSTELAVMVDGVLESYSMQLGCVRVTERALGKGVVNEQRREAATAMIDEQLEEAWRAVPAFATIGDVRLIGLAGSVSTLVQLEARMQEYDRELVHHRVISLATVREWRDRLANESPEDRLKRPGMIRGREDVLPAGLYVLAAVMERLGVDELLSSESDILDGITSSLLS
jgi:exopolyphosphatase/guanosine-5'-triphosphate,3'-diphosphate pyrophosphatase